MKSIVTFVLFLILCMGVYVLGYRTGFQDGKDEEISMADVWKYHVSENHDMAYINSVLKKLED